MHLAVDSFGRPLRFILTGGNRSDQEQALALIDGLPAAHVIADRAYDGRAILDAIEATGAAAVVPQRRGWHRPRAFDPETYKARNRIERTSAA